MKKRWIIMLALALLLLAACGGKQEPAQTESPAKPKTVAPLAPDLSLEDLEDCTFAAAFEPSDVHVTEGDLVITLAPYYTPKYDGADIGSLAPGDTLVLTDRQLKVEALERNGNHVAVNGYLGGIDALFRSLQVQIGSAHLQVTGLAGISSHGLSLHHSRLILPYLCLSHLIVPDVPGEIHRKSVNQVCPRHIEERPALLGRHNRAEESPGPKIQR